MITLFGLSLTLGHPSPCGWHLLQFIPKTLASPGYYQSKLPLKEDYGAHTFDNYDQANEANLRMLQSLERSPTDTKAIQDSFLDLLNRGFIVPLADLPQER